MSNESINNLIGTFASPAVTSSYNLNTEQLICIDTSRNRIGINTLDPSYAIHILNETIFSNKAIFNDLSLNNNLYVLGDTCLNNLEISGNLNIINGDLSLNSNLYVFGDTCLNNLEISGNLTIDGSRVIIIPSQTSNSGKYLTTDGTNLSWGTVTEGSDISLLNYSDASFNNVDISGVLNIINSDLSLNNNLYVLGDTSLNNLEISGNFKLKNNNNVFDISESIYLDTSSIIIDASNIRFDCSLIFLSNLPDSSAGLASNCLYRDISGYIKITL